jgi:hypothetical protein
MHGRNRRGRVLPGVSEPDGSSARGQPGSTRGRNGSDSERRRARRLGISASIAFVTVALLANLLLIPAHSIGPTRSDATAPSAPPPLLSGSGGTPSGGPPPERPLNDVPVLAAGANASFRRLAAGLPGTIELAIAPVGVGPTTVLGADVPAHGWSTMKVPVLVALLKARSEHGLQRLTAQQGVLAQAAITESSNESVLALFTDLEQMKGGLLGASRYVQGLFRSSGDTETVVTVAPPPPGAATTFGQTEWRPSQAVKFFRQLARGCLLSGSQTSYVLGLMEHIEPSESWGLGSADLGSIAFKGGWGPSPAGAYLVRQSAVIDPTLSSSVVVSVVAFPRSGSFSAGVDMLDRAGAWLRRELRLTARASSGCEVA